MSAASQAIPDHTPVRQRRQSRRRCCLNGRVWIASNVILQASTPVSAACMSVLATVVHEPAHGVVNIALTAALAMQVQDTAAEGQTEDVLLKQTRELYCSQSVSTTAKAWNDLRETVLRDALDNVLKPQFERELRARLVNDAREYVCNKCCSHVWGLASQGPFAVMHSHLLSMYWLLSWSFVFLNADVSCQRSKVPSSLS